VVAGAQFGAVVRSNHSAICVSTARPIPCRL
jgi:hypothetical protein